MTPLSTVLATLAGLGGFTACFCVFLLTVAFVVRRVTPNELPYRAPDPAPWPTWRTTETKVTIGAGGKPFSVRCDGNEVKLDAEQGYVVHQTPDGVHVTVGQPSSSNSSQPNQAAQAKAKT